MITISSPNRDSKELLQDNLKIIDRDMIGKIDTLDINTFLFRVKKDTIEYRKKKIPCLKFYRVWKHNEYETEEIFPRYIGFIGKTRNLIASPITERMEVALFLDEQISGEHLT